MNQKPMLPYRSQTPSLTPLRTTLQEAKIFAVPEPFRPQTDADGKLASTLIENVKKGQRRPSPFANWMGQPFPHEYKEMVAADVR